MYTVYMHKFPNDKVYIGITSKPVEVRWKRTYNKYFTNAVSKYGWDNIEHIIIAENLTKEEACSMEIKLIAKYNSTNSLNGYNLTSGGEGRAGYTLSADARRRIGEATRRNTLGKHRSDDFKQKISNARKGKHLSVETKEKLRQVNLGRVSPNKGVPMSEAQKLKISKSRKGYKMTDSQKEKLRQANLGKVQSEVTKQKRSESMKGRIYINNGKENKRIYANELDKYLTSGYKLGIVHNKDKI